MRRNQLFILLFVVAVIMLMIMATPALAQDTTPVKQALPTELMTPEQFDDLTSASGRAVGVGIAVGAPLVLLLTQLVKFIPQADTLKAENIAASWALVLTIVGSIAFNSGYGDIFDSSYETVSGLAPPLLMFFGAFAGSGQAYRVLKSGSGDKMGALTRSRSPGA